MSIPDFQRHVSSRITSISSNQVELIAQRLSTIGFDADADAIRDYVLEHKKYTDLLERRLRECDRMCNILVSVSFVSTFVAIGMSLFVAIYV